MLEIKGAGYAGCLELGETGPQSQQHQHQPWTSPAAASALDITSRSHWTQQQRQEGCQKGGCVGLSGSMVNCQGSIQSRLRHMGSSTSAARVGASPALQQQQPSRSELGAR
jgi:hypothetical protein